jgi:hypothetical protein
MEPERPSSDTQAPPAITGRRAAPRLRLAIPARFVSIYSTQRCVLIDLSRTGARMALSAPLNPGQPGYLEIDRMEVFGTIVRAQPGGEMAINALAFDDPMSQSAVLKVRAYAEGLEARTHMALRDQVRRWVTGEA